MVQQTRLGATRSIETTPIVAHCRMKPRRAQMFKLAKVLTLAWMLIAAATSAGQTQTLSATDIESIRSVIESQLAAFATDDAQTAFSFASEGIRGTFGTADNFLAMVKSSYPVVYRPASVLFLEPEKIGDEIMQGVETPALIELQLGLPCQSCHCHDLFAAFAPSAPIHIIGAVFQYGAERLDLADFGDAVGVIAA